MKNRVVRDKKSWPGCEKVMKRQREKTHTSANLIDKHALPPPLCRGSVDCKLIRDGGPHTGKVMGMCDRITPNREIIMGINQHLTHCYKYEAAQQGRGLKKRPQRQSGASHSVQMLNTEVAIHHRRTIR